MKKQPYHNKNINAALKAAREEEPFSASDIIEELAPLLPDYFVGSFIQMKDKIIMSFFNGQNFKLTISQFK